MNTPSPADLFAHGQALCIDMLDGLVRFARDRQRVNAVKFVRDATGLSLKESKDAIDVLIPYKEPAPVPAPEPYKAEDYTHRVMVQSRADGDYVLINCGQTLAEANHTARQYCGYGGYNEVTVVKLMSKSVTTLTMKPV